MVTKVACVAPVGGVCEPVVVFLLSGGLMSSADAQASMSVAFHGVTPILRVSQLDASLNYYVGVLGFEMDWRNDDGNSFASVSRGQCQLFLSVGDQGNPGSWMWIGVSDVDALH